VHLLAPFSSRPARVHEYADRRTVDDSYSGSGPFVSSLNDFSFCWRRPPSGVAFSVWARTMCVPVCGFDVHFRGQAGRLFESNNKLIIDFTSCKTISNPMVLKSFPTMARDCVAKSVSKDKANY